MKAEDSLTISVANYLRLQYPTVLFTHIANERKTNKRKNPKTGRWYTPEGNKLKRMGVQPGMPDIMIFKPHLKDHIDFISAGLFLELKIGKNRPTEHQKSTMEKLIDNLWVGAVCYSFDEAKKEIDNYLKS